MESRIEVAPLLIATGAGAASQRVIGTVVFGGMLSSTLLAIPFIPVFYVLMERLGERPQKGRSSSKSEAVTSLSKDGDHKP
jgi:HAE1 family hydrophobic/amphiphilic exporter-1